MGFELFGMKVGTKGILTTHLQRIYYFSLAVTQQPLLPRFIVETQKTNGEHYPPKTVHQLL